LESGVGRDMVTIVELNELIRNERLYALPDAIRESRRLAL
jgi:hypothetical protein